MSEQTAAWQQPDLSSTVAVVTGASRGVGRGIALALGDAGATVYVTGRSHRDGERTEGLPGTVDETAEQVTARGGTGIPVICDHFADADNEQLFDTVRERHQRLDLLVNNAWSGYERSDEARFDAKFWTQPRWRWDTFASSLRSQFICSQLAVPLMLPHERGLIVNISFTDGDVYLGQTPYDVCKHGSDRMVTGMAYELRKHGVSAVALHPGFVRTERVDAAWTVLGDGPAQVAHSPEYVGRAIASLSADPDLPDYSGQRLSVGELSERYGFTDLDGRQLPPFKLEGRITLAARMERLNRVAASNGGASA